MYKLVINFCWIAFCLYWIAAGTQSESNSKTTNRKLFGGIRLGLLMVVAIAGFNRLPQSFWNQALSSSSGIKVLGLVIFMTGFGLSIWARLTIGKNWGMPMAEKQNPELVTTGPYRFVRHPIYTGVLAMAAGSAIDTNAFWLLAFIVFAFYFIYSAVMEERNMTRRFGELYLKYKQSTKMLIPFLF